MSFRYYCRQYEFFQGSLKWWIALSTVNLAQALENKSISPTTNSGGLLYHPKVITENVSAVCCQVTTTVFHHLRLRSGCQAMKPSNRKPLCEYATRLDMFYWFLAAPLLSSGSRHTSCTRLDWMQNDQQGAGGPEWGPTTWTAQRTAGSGPGNRGAAVPAFYQHVHNSDM